MHLQIDITVATPSASKSRTSNSRHGSHSDPHLDPIRIPHGSHPGPIRVPPRIPSESLPCFHRNPIRIPPGSHLHPPGSHPDSNRTDPDPTRIPPGSHLHPTGSQPDPTQIPPGSHADTTWIPHGPHPPDPPCSVLRESPPVYIVHDFLTERECEQMLNYTLPRMGPSVVVGGGTSSWRQARHLSWLICMHASSAGSSACTHAQPAHLHARLIPSVCRGHVSGRACGSTARLPAYPPPPVQTVIVPLSLSLSLVHRVNR